MLSKMGDIFNNFKEAYRSVFNFSLSRILLIILVALFMHCYIDISQHPFDLCEKGERCYYPYWKNNSRFQLLVAVSKQTQIGMKYNLEVVFESDAFDIFAAKDINLNLAVPSEVRQNGTITMLLLLTILGDGKPVSLTKAIEDYKSTVTISLTITKYMFPAPKLRYLLQKQRPANEKLKRQKQVISHWAPQMHFHVVPEPQEVKAFAEDFGPFIKISNEGKYFPFFYTNELESSFKEYLPLNKSCKQMPFTLSYSPASLGDLRIYALFSGMFLSPDAMGRNAEQSEHLRSILFNTSFYWLKISLVVAFVHFILEIIAFKKDVSFWKSKENMQGVSLRGTIWRCVSRFIIMFHLWDQGTNKILLFPIGLTLFVEVWKVFKMRKVHLKLTGWRPNFQMGSFSREEKQSMDFDYVVSRNLVVLFLPVFFSYCLYCLIYTQYTGWQSFISEISVHGVYAFGFLFMIPQLLLNYKLKSVAHLPLAALAFKVCSTFIDDFFAIVVKLPTVHRIACFRDDVVLFIFLIQWWIYPVDPKRVNEYGQNFNNEMLNAANESYPLHSHIEKKDDAELSDTASASYDESTDTADDFTEGHISSKENWGLESQGELQKRRWLAVFDKKFSTAHHAAFFNCGICEDCIET